MLRATQSCEIPGGDISRIRADDSERTRMLKEVMKSVAKYASAGLGKGQNESAQAAGQLMMKAAAEEEEEIRRAVQQKEWDPCPLGFLSCEQETSILSSVVGDDDVTELEAAKEFSELLRHSSSLVNSHTSSLSCSGPLPEKPRHIDPSSGDICLIARREAEDLVAGGADDNKRREQAALSWVKGNVKFKDLDKLSRHIDDTQKYEDLRGHFEQHHKYHPVLRELSDHSLVDHTMWERAVGEAMFPTAIEAEAIPKFQPSFFAPKALSKTKGLRGATGSGTGSSFQSGAKANRISWGGSSSVSPASLDRGVQKLPRDRSAPALR